jgi:O-antigen/teichoic acid export membrane protein
MTEVVIVPLSVLFLPLAAQQVRDGKVATLERQAQLIFDSVLVMSAFIVAQAMAWTGPLLHAVFEDKYASATTLVLVTVPAILPYLMYAGFRSYIDGYSVKPVNFLHLLAGSVLVLVTSPLLGRALGGFGLALGYTLGVTLLGALTLRYVHTRLHVQLWTKPGTVVLGLAAMTGSHRSALPAGRECARCGLLLGLRGQSGRVLRSRHRGPATCRASRHRLRGVAVASLAQRWFRRSSHG